MKSRFSLWCQVIWNVFIFVFLLFVFGNLIQRRVVGISVGAEELFFLILIPIFLLINLKPTFVNIKKLYIKYHENLNDETLSYESETNRYAFMNMYQRLSRRRVCLPLIFPLLSITVLTILFPIISKGVLSWKIVFMMFSHLSMQLAFLPSILIPPIISLKIYFSSRHNLDMLRKIYDHLSTNWPHKRKTGGLCIYKRIFNQLGQLLKHCPSGWDKKDRVHQVFLFSFVWNKVKNYMQQKICDMD